MIPFREGGGGLGWGSVIRFICDFMFSDLAKFMNTLDYFVIFMFSDFVKFMNTLF